MRTTNLNLMMQKGSRVVQMIIAHKSFHIIYIFKRLDQKIKLRWQWNSVYYSFKAANNKSTDKTTICADRYVPLLNMVMTFFHNSVTQKMYSLSFGHPEFLFR